MVMVVKLATKKLLWPLKVQQLLSSRLKVFTPHISCTSSHGEKPWPSRLHRKEAVGPDPVNSTVAVPPFTVTPSLIRCTVHVLGLAVYKKRGGGDTLCLHDQYTYTAQTQVYSSAVHELLQIEKYSLLKMFRRLLRRQKLNARKIVMRTFNICHPAMRRKLNVRIFLTRKKSYAQISRSTVLI